MIRRHRQKGFTLIESLVALAIAAVVINGFYAGLSTGSLLDRRAGLQAEKVFVATNILDQVGIDLPLRAGLSETGRLDGLTWALNISSQAPPDMQLGPTYPGELLFVSVSVRDPNRDDDPIVLRAIRYAQSPL